MPTLPTLRFNLSDKNNHPRYRFPSVFLSTARLRRRPWGFTLHELMVTLSIAGILSTTGVSVYGLVNRELMTAHINTIIGHLHLARSEAIKRSQPVVMCKSRSGIACTPEASWTEGWLIYADANNNKRQDPDESVIRVQQALQGKVALRFGETGKYHRVTYHPSGRATPNATFTLCSQTRPRRARAVILYWTGRPRASAKNSRGKPLECPPI